MPDLVWMTDAAGRPLYQNVAWRAFTGMTGDELARIGWQTIHHPEELDQQRRLWDEAVARGGPVEFEGRLRRHDGEFRWFSGRTVSVKDETGQVVNWVGTLTDIHDRKEVERALAETAASLTRERERLAIALRTGALGVYEWRVGDSVVWWSPEMYPLFGLEPSSDPLSVDAFSSFIHPDDRAELWRKTQECIARQEAFRHEYRIIRTDGTVRWMMNQSQVGVDQQGRVERITGVATDITEKRELEEALKEADRKKDEFLGILAHELRNPLAPIRNGLQLIKLADGLPETVERSRAMMERQLNQMVRLIDDLMDLTRITQGKLVLQKQRMILSLALRDAIDASAPLLERREQTLTVQIPDAPIPIDGDGTRLAQVFSNLLNNAAKYTDKGGRLRLCAEHRGSEAVVTVEDNGIGIPAPMLPKVFDMFTQVDRSLERTQGGLGIGLSIVKRLVEMHGGRVQALSDGHDRGSRFVVSLPVAASTANETTASPDEGATAVRRRILVVDDNRDGAGSLAELLELMGNDAQTAHDGVEALEVAETFRPQLILMDLGMPRLNGFDACRRIRAAPWGKTMLIVAQTGWAQEEDKRRVQEAGFDLHLVKPVDAAKLKKLLSTLAAT